MRILAVVGFLMFVVGSLAIGIFRIYDIPFCGMEQGTRRCDFQCARMDEPSVRMDNRSSRSLVAEEEPISIMFYGEGIGQRILILDGEESVRVFLRVYFYSSANCTWNETVFPPATIKSIMLDYNQSYALQFDEVNGSHVWIFNVHTSTEEEYLEEELYVQRQRWIDDLFQARAHVLSFGVAAVFFAVKVRRMER